MSDHKTCSFIRTDKGRFKYTRCCSMLSILQEHCHVYDVKPLDLWLVLWLWLWLWL